MYGQQNVKTLTVYCVYYSVQYLKQMLSILKKHVTNSVGWYTLHLLKVILENKALDLIPLGFRVNSCQ